MEFANRAFPNTRSIEVRDLAPVGKETTHEIILSDGRRGKFEVLWETGKSRPKPRILSITR